MRCITRYRWSNQAKCCRLKDSAAALVPFVEPHAVDTVRGNRTEIPDASDRHHRTASF